MLNRKMTSIFFISGIFWVFLTLFFLFLIQKTEITCELFKKKVNNEKIREKYTYTAQQIDFIEKIEESFVNR